MLRSGRKFNSRKPENALFELLCPSLIVPNTPLAEENSSVSHICADYAGVDLEFCAFNRECCHGRRLSVHLLWG